MSANERNPRKSTSSFSKREKIRRNPFNRRNNLSISLRLLYISRSYSQGATRVLRGGTTGRNPNANASWRWRCPHMPGPSTGTGSAPPTPGPPTVCAPPAHRGPVPVRGRTSRLFEHPRQPYESWWSSHPGTCRWTEVRFFKRTGPIGMNLDGRAVQRNRLQLDAHHLLSLQIIEHPVKHSFLRPSVHPSVDGVPVAEARRQPTPLAALLSDVQNGIENLQVGQTDVATLNREDWGYAFVLSLCNLHAYSVPRTNLFV